MNKSNNMNAKKIISILAIILLVLNLILYEFRIYSGWIFWAIIILCAILAFIIPKLK